MKRLLTQDIIEPAQMPITADGLDLLQDSYTNILTALSKSAFHGGLNYNDPHWINKIEFLGASQYITENVLFYNDQLFYLDTFFIGSNNQNLYHAYIDTYYNSSNPIKFTDGNYHNAYENKVVICLTTSGATAPAGHSYEYVGQMITIPSAPASADFASASATTTTINGLATGLTYNHGLITGITTNVLTKYVQIGNWNMYAGGGGVDNRAIAHGLSNVIGVQVSIKNDAGTYYTDLIGGDSVGTSAKQGAIYWDGTYVYLKRLTSGLFDTTDFSNASFMRGYMLITYQS